MANSPSTLPTLLSLYTALRRSGSTEAEAQAKLRGLLGQLNLDDRRALVKDITDWESQYGGQVEQDSLAKGQYRATLASSTDAAQLYGDSRLDEGSRTNTDTVLKPRRPIVACPSCGKMNDSAKPLCAYCGKPLEPVQVSQPSDDVVPTWFGPTSKLVLTIGAVDQPLEIAVPNLVTLGRNTVEDSLTDIDLSRYKANVYGVSRLHASIKRQNNSLTLTDMHSKNHTFLNGNELKDGEVCTLKSGDKISLGMLVIVVTFKHPQP